jgi:hypothetical protein
MSPGPWCRALRPLVPRFGRSKYTAPASKKELVNRRAMVQSTPHPVVTHVNTKKVMSMSTVHPSIICRDRWRWSTPWP